MPVFSNISQQPQRKPSLLLCSSWPLFPLWLQVKPLPATQGGKKKLVVEKKMTSLPNPKAAPRLVPPTSASLPTPEVAPQPTPEERKGTNGMATMPRLFDASCDETLCSADSFCVNDYTWGGSRCHCNLGKGGDSCSEGRCLGTGKRGWGLARPGAGGRFVVYIWVLFAL